MTGLSSTGGVRRGESRWDSTRELLSLSDTATCTGLHFSELQCTVLHSEQHTRTLHTALQSLLNTVH